jgi:hypothetical protein
MSKSQPQSPQQQPQQNPSILPRSSPAPLKPAPPPGRLIKEEKANPYKKKA